MSTSRFNVFNQIHKGLRALLFDTIMQVQQADLTDAAGSEAAINQVALLLDLFDTHAHHEDRFILHLAEQCDPALIKDFESEHETDLALSTQLRAGIEAYRTASDKYRVGYDLYYALIDFATFNLTHMNKEERLLNSVLWEHYSDADILGMQHNIEQSVPPEKMGIYFEWMIKGINDTELLKWLGAVQREAPEFVYNGLLQACAAHLPQNRWVTIEARAMENSATL